MIALLAVLVAVAGCGGGASGSTAGGTTGGRDGAGPGSSEVSFLVDGTTTYGTLEVPPGPSGRPLAAALLIPGSGPTDRDGDDPPALTADTLGLIAELLAEDGIASLRYDKYFAGKTGGGRYASDPGSFTFGAEIRQADAAYGFLATRPHVDPAQLLVVGHSEGGAVALAVADSVARPPAGLALLEPQDQRSLDVARIQADEAIAAQVSTGSIDAGQGRADAHWVADAIAKFRADRPVSATGMPPYLSNLIEAELLDPDNAGFTRSHDRVVPAALAARVRAGTRVLVTDGTRDTNIPPSTIGPLARALTAAGTSGPGLTLLPGVDHLLHTAAQPDSEAVLAPSVVAAIREWTRPYAGR